MLENISDIQPHFTIQLWRDADICKVQTADKWTRRLAHQSDFGKRQELINYPILRFDEAARIGTSFYRQDDRPIALNFALTKGFPLNPGILLNHFDPSVFVIKLTPLNPTDRGQQRGLQTQIDPHNGDGSDEIVRILKQAGYKVILSLGEPEEDRIGSNCGQYVNRYISGREKQSA